MKISQSLINDIFISRSDQVKDVISPKACPAYLKFKYVDGLDTVPSDAMNYGRYFEYFLLGATRDMVEPIIPRVGIKNLKPTKSASIGDMTTYLISKGVEVTVSSKKDLFAIIEKMPEDKSLGTPSTIQQTLDLLIENAKNILDKMGLPVDKGLKQVLLTGRERKGHLDWITDDFQKKGRKCIIDVKFTQTQEDDWRNGWANIDEKENAKIQAQHYSELYKEVYGEYVPFYFFIFGQTGWIKIIQMIFTPEGMSMYQVSFTSAKSLANKYIKEKWPASPLYNRCLKCDFNEVCKSRATLPEVTEYTF